MIGCTSPLERIDSASSASSSSRKSLRGLSLLGRTSAVATMRCSPSGGSCGRPPGTGSPISEASPRPRRLFCSGAFMVPLGVLGGVDLSGLVAALALNDLGRELDVGLAPGAVEVVEQDRLAV